MIRTFLQGCVGEGHGFFRPGVRVRDHGPGTADVRCRRGRVGPVRGCHPSTLPETAVPPSTLLIARCRTDRTTERRFSAILDLLCPAPVRRATGGPVAAGVRHAGADPQPPPSPRSM